MRKELKQYKKLACIATSLGILLTLNGTRTKVDASSISTKTEYTKISTDDITNKYSKYIYEIKNYINELTRETIYIGDSRTEGMLASGVIDEEHTIYGIGYGYKWLIGDSNFKESKTNAINGALNELPNKMKQDKLYNIAIWLGVNDYKYYDAYTYFETFMNLALNNKEHNIYIVSIGPVSDNPNCPRNNKPINEFNQIMEELIRNANIENLKYIDLELTKNSIKKYDHAGIHYGMDDYINIQNIIENSINENKNFTKTLK